MDRIKSRARAAICRCRYGRRLRSTDEHVLDAIDSCQVVSFDVFDTLVFRECIQGLNVFHQVEKISGSCRFVQRRVAAEKMALCALLSHGCEEVTLGQIYDQLPECDRGLMSLEEDCELRSCVQNSEMARIWNYALSKNKRIIVCSDMYLSEQMIRRILAKCGYEGFSKVYVSSACGLRKSSGHLYDFVIRDMGVDPASVLHLGDNAFSDGVMAISRGLNARLYHSPISTAFMDWPFMRDFLNVHYEMNVSQMVVKCVNELNMLNSHPDRGMSYWFQIGFLFGGPIAAIFCRKIYKSCMDDKLDELLFVARDGYALHRVFVALYPQVAATYVYAPRMTSLLATLNMGTDNAVVAERNALLQNYRKVHGLNTDAEVFQLSRNKIENYSRYLRMVVGKGKNVGVVDGFSASFSAQTLIEKALNRRTHGFYLGIADCGKIDAWHKSLLSNVSPFFMEFLFSAPEPPIQDVLDGKPIYRNPAPQEKLTMELYPELLKGIESGAKCFSSCGIHVGDSEWVEDWVRAFEKGPSTRDVKMFRRIQHGVDIGHRHYKPVFEAWGRFSVKKFLVTKGVVTLQRYNNRGRIVRTVRLFGWLPIWQSKIAA